MSGEHREGERKRTADDASKLPFKTLSKPEAPSISGTSLRETWLLLRRQPVYKRHELDTGIGTERENLTVDAKGNDKWRTP